MFIQLPFLHTACRYLLHFNMSAFFTYISHSFNMPDTVLDPENEKITKMLFLREGGLPWWFSGKECTCQCRRRGFDFWVRKIPWRRKCQSTLVCLPGKSHGQRSLSGYSPWDCKELDMA